MEPENKDVSFNLVQDLNILFVDIDNRDGKRQYRGVERFFQSDTILWDFIHEYRKSFLYIKRKTCLTLAYSSSQAQQV
jgi:hypothetical protein